LRPDVHLWCYCSCSALEVLKRYFRNVPFGDWRNW
jgi:hypothetical protein